MTEQELMKKIKESAETVKTPERITPERIKNTLDLRAEWETTNDSNGKTLEQDNEKIVEQEGGRVHMEKKQKKESLLWQKIYCHGRQYVAVAAVFLLICGLGIFAAASAKDSGNNHKNGPSQVADAITNQTGESNISGNHGQADTEEMITPEPKKDAGELYVVAANYGEVYDALEEMYRVEEEKYGIRDFVYDVVTTLTGGGLKREDVEDVALNESAALMDGAETGSVSDASAMGTSGSSYSKTNLQTEGVDESDIIKTDGSYIYTVNGSNVYITDVRSKEMKEAGKISVAMNSASDRIREMYVDGDTVNLIVSKQESVLKESAVSESGTETVDSIQINDVYYFDTNQVTALLTYDISDPENPVLKGSITQEGNYKTSRKIGDVVYLFTNKYMSRPEITRTVAVEDGGVGGWIPVVDGNPIAADCIYIPERGTAGLVVSSVNVQKPEDIVDNIMIINNNVEIYVSTTAIYLYGQNYDSYTTTEIAKFSMEQGIINAVGATNVPGAVYDTFAVNEYQGKLRILTTDWSKGGNENNLYLLDEKLNTTGKLEGLAPGEQIYSARFFKDMAYFVTYRNIDPLFAVDLSDAANPKVLSELKITGFSEYLHFWGEDKLVGIGYETDPDTGRQEGIKITMFDISNPADLKTAGTCVLENVDYSPALYNYKCVLVHKGENLIGFAGESYQSSGTCNSYLLFSWEDGAFQELLTETLPLEAYLDHYRGLYIDDTFYLANPNEITSYDRMDGYKMVQKLEF